MFQPDDKFLQDIGLDQLPEEQRQAFIQHVYDELELRVGNELSENLNEEQLDQFEAIIDGNEAVINDWLNQNAPDYQQTESFQKLQQAMQLDNNDLKLRTEYAASRWLEINRPDYRDVVMRVLEDLKQEVKNNREAILGSL